VNLQACPFPPCCQRVTTCPRTSLQAQSHVTRRSGPEDQIRRKATHPSSYPVPSRRIRRWRRVCAKPRALLPKEAPHARAHRPQPTHPPTLSRPGALGDGGAFVPSPGPRCPGHSTGASAARRAGAAAAGAGERLGHTRSAAAAYPHCSSLRHGCTLIIAWQAPPAHPSRGSSRSS